MNLKGAIPGILCILAVSAILFRLTHYAKFYATSYILWIGFFLVIVGFISLIKPLKIVWIYHRKTAAFIIAAGTVLSLSAVCWPIKVYKSAGKQKIDSIMPYYSFNEYHEVIIQASPEKVKAVLKTMKVRDIPIVDLLMRIRGLPADKEEKEKLTQINQNEGTFRTPDFNYFEVDSTELIALLLVKTSAKTDTPKIKSIQQFLDFDKTGYIKVALNFRIIPLGDGRTLVTTETRNHGLAPNDRNIFGRYWKVIYPGSAIIRRLWLDTLAKKATILEYNPIYKTDD